MRGVNASTPASIARPTLAQSTDWPKSKLLSLPSDFAWERFATEDRKVTWDGYVSYDGVLYGLPGKLTLAGKQVQVRERKGVLTVWNGGKQVFEIAKRPRSQDSVPHSEQRNGVPPAHASRRGPTPLGHQQLEPAVESRSRPRI